MLTYGRACYPETQRLCINTCYNPQKILYQQTSGNENLHNQLNNNWGLQYYGNYKLARIGFNLNYSRIRGLIRDISNTNASDLIETMSTNVDLNESYTAGFSADFTLFKNLRFSHFNNYSYIVQRSQGYLTKLWSGYISDRISYQVDKQNSFDLGAVAYSPNVTLQGVDQDMAYLNWTLSYGHYFDWMKKFPTAISIRILNPTHYNGLPGYSTINTPEFMLRSLSEFQIRLSWQASGYRLKEKQSGNRTFNKTKSIQNTDPEPGRLIYLAATKK